MAWVGPGPFWPQLSQLQSKGFLQRWLWIFSSASPKPPPHSHLPIPSSWIALPIALLPVALPRHLHQEGSLTLVPPSFAHTTMANSFGVHRFSRYTSPSSRWKGGIHSFNLTSVEPPQGWCCQASGIRGLGERAPGALRSVGEEEAQDTTGKHRGGGMSGEGAGEQARQSAGLAQRRDGDPSAGTPTALRELLL